MREVKFRGKRPENDEWIFGSLDNTTFDSPSIITKDEGQRFVDRSTVGQWVGLRDKTGKEIYEGDILEAKEYWGEQDYAEVVWNEQQLQWYLTRNGEPREPLRSPFANGSMAFEIVGNVYENPEMVRSKS